MSPLGDGMNLGLTKNGGICVAVGRGHGHTAYKLLNTSTGMKQPRDLKSRVIKSED